MAYLVALVPYITAATAVVGAGAAIDSADNQRRQMHFQADQAREEAKEQVIAANIAATNARQTEADAQVSWSDMMRDRQRALGANVTAVAKSGLTLTGSAEDVYQDTAMAFATDANRTLFSGLNEAGNYRASGDANRRSALNLGLTSDNYKRSATAASRSGAISAGGRLIGGIGDTVQAAYRPSQSSLTSKKSSARRGP